MRKTATKLRPGPAFEPCANCVSGWVLYYVVPARETRMHRCPCWHAHQAKIAELEAAQRSSGRPRKGQERT